MIIEAATMRAIREQVRAEGMRTLLEAALQRVRDGETTLEEVARVVGDDGEGSLRSVPLAEVPDGRDRRRRPPSPNATPTPTIRAAPAPEIAEEDDAAPHVLVVDDDGASRAIARGLLEREGYRVSEAADGSEGLVMLARGEAFDLMVLDLDMPTLGGRETLRAVRGSVSTAGLPIVVLTGTQDPRAEIELMEQGADDYIHKPIDPPRFVTRVKATLRRAGG
jgi:CheY-like chemotaxis protein